MKHDKHSNGSNSSILTFLKNIISFGIAMVDDTIQKFGELALGMKKKGIAEGVRGIPDSNIRTAAISEKGLFQGFNHAKNEVKQGIIGERERLKLKKAVIEVNETHVLSDEMLHKQRENSKSNAGYEAKRSYKKGFWSGWLGKKGTIDFQTRINDLVEQVRDLSERLQLMHETHENLKFKGLPIKMPWDYAWVYWFGMIALFVLEVGINFSSISEAKLDKFPIANLSIGFVLALLQGIFAVFLGIAIAKRNFRDIAIHGVLFLIFCIGMGSIRWNTSLSMDLRYISSGISLFFGLGMIFLTHKRHINFDYFQNLERRKKTSAKIVRLNSKIRSLEEESEHRTAQAIEQSGQKWNVNQLEEKKAKEKRVQQIDSEIAQLAMKESQALDCLKQVYLLALDDYRASNQRSRASSGYSAVLLWEEKKGNDPTEPISPTPPDNDPLNISPLSKIASLFIVVMGLGLSACSDKTHIEPVAELNHIEILYDVTGDNKDINVEAMVSYILEEVGINEADDEFEETHITFSQITQLSSPEIHQVSLEASKGSYWFRDGEAHQQAIHTFYAELSEKIALITQASIEQDESHIHRNMQSRLAELVNKNGKKLVLIWSDLLQNSNAGTSESINFYGYISNPSKLLEDEQKLINKMEKGYELPDLEGVRMVNHHRVHKKHDEIYEVVKKLFKNQWEAHNAQVEYRKGPDFIISGKD